MSVDEKLNNFALDLLEKSQGVTTLSILHYLFRVKYPLDFQSLRLFFSNLKFVLVLKKELSTVYYEIRPKSHSSKR